jgi:hypothetical protein
MKAKIEVIIREAQLLKATQSNSEKRKNTKEYNLLQAN